MDFPQPYPTRHGGKHFAGYVDFATGEIANAGQPAYVQDGTAVFFSGYLADGLTTASDFPKKSTSGPAAAMHAAWKRDGINLSRNLPGAYSAVIINPGAQEVVLVQDSMAMRTVFYNRAGTRLYFSDILADLLGMAGMPELELDYFASWLRFGYASTSLTPYRGVFRLCGGETQVTGRTAMRSHFPWRPTVRPASFRGSAQEARRALAAGVEEAVAATTHSLEAPVFELSGGLDSTTVAVLAHKRGDGPIRTLTWTDPADDDGDYARQVASMFQFQGIEIPLEHLSGGSPFGPQRFRSEPGNEFCPELERLLGPEKLGACDAIVTGVGGDNVFFSRGCPPIWLADLVARGQLGRALGLAHSPQNAELSKRSALAYLWLYGVKPLWEQRRETRQHTPSDLFTADFSERCAGLPQRLLPDPAEGSSFQRHYWNQLRQLIANRVAVEHLMPAREFRHPLLHRPLAELALSLHGVFDTTLASDRQLQRAAFAGVVPEIVLNRKTKGGSISADVKRMQSNAFRAFLSSRTPLVVEHRIVSHRKWTELLDRSAYGHFSSLREFDLLLKTELWLRHREQAVPHGVAADHVVVGCE